MVICDWGMIWHGGQGGAKLAGSRNAWDRTVSFQGSEVSFGDKEQLQLCLAASWNESAQGAKPQGQTLSSRAGWSVDPQAEVLHANNFGFGAVYIRNLVEMHLCRFHVEPHIVMGLCPMHCSLTCFIFKHKGVFNSPRRYHKNSPTGATSEPCWCSCSWSPLSFASSRCYSPSSQSRAKRTVHICPTIPSQMQMSA